MPVLESEYRILAVIRTHPVCSTSPSSGILFVAHPLLQGISYHVVPCIHKSMGIYIRLLAHPPIYCRSNINKRRAYHRKNTVVLGIHAKIRFSPEQAAYFPWVIVADVDVREIALFQ